MSEHKETVAAIWADVLGLEPGLIQGDANFFELGGDSIMVTIMVMQVEDALKVIVNPEVVYEFPHLDEFVDKLMVGQLT